MTLRSLKPRSADLFISLSVDICRRIDEGRHLPVHLCDIHWHEGTEGRQSTSSPPVESRRRRTERICIRGRGGLMSLDFGIFKAVQQVSQHPPFFRCLLQERAQSAAPYTGMICDACWNGSTYTVENMEAYFSSAGILLTHPIYRASRDLVYRIHCPPIMQSLQQGKRNPRSKKNPLR